MLQTRRRRQRFHRLVGKLILQNRQAPLAKRFAPNLSNRTLAPRHANLQHLRTLAPEALYFQTHVVVRFLRDSDDAPYHIARVVLHRALRIAFQFAPQMQQRRCTLRPHFVAQSVRQSRKPPSVLMHFKRPAFRKPRQRALDLSRQLHGRQL
jgi:hypothetical protein